ncbi:unnamed protein product [Discosporangium mesarthrocarpum]
MTPQTSRDMPPLLVRDVCDLLAFARCGEVVRHIVSRCRDHASDALIVVDSPLHRRLEIVTVEESLETALSAAYYDPEEAPEKFDVLLSRFDKMRIFFSGTEAPVGDWDKIRSKMACQVALSYIRAQVPGGDDDPEGGDLEGISTQAYLETVDQLFPDMRTRSKKPEDMEIEEFIKLKTRKKLRNIFTDGRKQVSVRTIESLLQENKLNDFETNVKDFLRGLEMRYIPEPKLWKQHSADYEHLELPEGQNQAFLDTRRITRGAGGRLDHRGPRREGVGEITMMVEEEPGYKGVDALKKANGELQEELNRMGPGAVEEALGNDLSPNQPSSMESKHLKRMAPVSSRSPGGHKRFQSSTASGAQMVLRSSIGEQVDFEDSQSNDERPTRLRLPTVPAAAPPALLDDGRQFKSKRQPWSAQEVSYLQEGVKKFGDGKWIEIVKHYPFHEKRSNVDLKDKWKNINKKR